MITTITKFGEGVLVQDTEPNKMAMVSPVEVVTDIDTDLTSFKEKHSTSLKDTKGVKARVSVDRTSFLEATWWPAFDPNRATAPNLVMGERVQLWQVGEEDKYYWTSNRGLDPKRNLEDIVYLFSNKEDHNEGLDPGENTVMIVTSTLEQSFRIVTPVNRDEPTKLMVDVNYGKGRIEFTTPDGKRMLYDPANDKFKVKMSKIEFECDECLITGRTFIDNSLKVDTTVKSGGDISSGANIKSTGKVSAGITKTITGQPGHLF